MVNQLLLQTVSVVLAGISVSLAAVYYALILKRQQETRNAQFFMQIYQEAQNEGFLRAIAEAIWVQEHMEFDEWWDKYGPENNMEFFNRWWKMIVFFEGVGIMVRRNLIDIEMVDDYMSGPIMLTWERYGHIIQAIRERDNYPQFQEWHEYLTDEIRKIVEKQHPDFRK